MVNLTTLTGRIFQTELRYTQGGKAVAQSSISFKTGKNKDYSYVNLTFWDTAAERIDELTRGDDNSVMVTVRGYLKQDKWENKKGEKRSKIVLTVTNFEVIDTDKTFLDVGEGQKKKKKKGSKKKKTTKRRPREEPEEEPEEESDEEEEELDDSPDLPF